MEFGKEYKKFGQDISPDREAIDRMKANVMSEVGRRRKPLPLGKIAVSCGSVAACAAIVITAAVLIPRTDSNNMTAGTSASSMAEISNEITTDTAADAETAAGDFSYNDSTTDSDQGMIPSWNEAADDVIEDDAADEDIWTDDDIDISAPDNAFANDAINADSGNKGYEADDRADITDDIDDGMPNPGAGDDGSADSVTDEIIENDEVTPDNGDDNYDFDDGVDDGNYDFDDSVDDSIDFDHDIGDDSYDFDDEIDDDGFDDDICDDTADDSADDFDDDACDDSYDEVDSLGSIDKAKFSGDRNRLMVILHDGSRQSYTLTYENVDMPEGLTSEYFIDEGTGTEYIAQLNGVYLRVNDLGNNLIALYRLDK